MYPFIDESRKSLPAEFVETICVEQGKALNLSYHNERMNRTRKFFWNDVTEDLRLEAWIHPEKYEICTRCRVVYGKEIKFVEYFPYQLREVNSLQLVVDDDIDYSYKWTDRSPLSRLFAERGNADDVLIVRKNLITDTSIANVALCDGEVWYTPKQPLLKGTRRQRLLDERKIQELDIQVSDLSHFQKIRLFNAMIPFGRIEFDTANIIGLLSVQP